MTGTNCEECEYYTYDEDFDSYECDYAMDEDDVARAALYKDRYVCPYFCYRDEYRIVRKQN